MTTDDPIQAEDDPIQAADMIYAPWTIEQVRTINDFQQLEHLHPFTCGTEGCRADLVATVRGWICLFCDYTQGWCMSTQADRMILETFKNHSWNHSQPEDEGDAASQTYSIQYQQKDSVCRMNPMGWTIAGHVRGAKSLDVKALFLVFWHDSTGTTDPPVTDMSTCFTFIQWLTKNNFAKPVLNPNLDVLLPGQSV